MFPIYSSINTHPPSLLGGFRGIGFPPFNRYYEDGKTAFALLDAFGFPRHRYHFALLPYFIVQGDNRDPEASGLWSPVARNRWFRVETVGSPKFPWKPLVGLPCSQTPAGT